MRILLIALLVLLIGFQANAGTSVYISDNQVIYYSIDEVKEGFEPTMTIYRGEFVDWPLPEATETNYLVFKIYGKTAPVLTANAWDYVVPNEPLEYFYPSEGYVCRYTSLDSAQFSRGLSKGNGATILFEVPMEHLIELRARELHIYFVPMPPHPGDLELYKTHMLQQ